MALFGFTQRDRLDGPVQDEFDSLYARLQRSSAGDGVQAVINGGTGINEYVQGDLIVASAADDLDVITAVATGNALISQGLKTEPVWGKIGLTTHVSGALPVPNGGTNIVSYAIGDLLSADGATSLAKIAAVAVGKVFVSKGVTTAPAWDIVGTLPLERIAGSTFSSVQDLQDVFHSAGWVSGGATTDGGSETVNISAGTGLIRDTNSAAATLLYFDWAAETALAIPTDTTRFLGIEYNGGSPQVVINTLESDFDYKTAFILATVVNEAGILYIQTELHAVGDHAGNMIERLYQTMPFMRDARTGGLIIGEIGTRNITMSAGNLWERLERFDQVALNTTGGGGDTFDSYVRDGSGGWTLATGLTQWPNDSYDNNAGTPTVMTNNRWAVLWFYIELDNELVMVYGQAQYVSEAQAEGEAPPSSLPERIVQHGKLISRLIFQKSAATAQAIESVFGTTFPASLVTDHGNLAGLGDDDHTQYALVDGTRPDITAVIGPASAVDDDIAVFDGTTGKLIKNGGQTISEVIAAGAAAAPQGDVVGPGVAVDDNLATFDLTTGKLIQDGGSTIAEVVAAGVAGAISAILPIDLTADVTGDLPFANMVQIATARLLGRVTAATGDIEVLSALPAAIDALYALADGTRAFTGPITVPNSGLHILDTNGSHDLIFAVGSDILADRTLTFTTSDSDRTITLSGNPTLADWFDQSLKTGDQPRFGGVNLNNNGLHLLDTDASHDLIISPGSNLTADRTLTITTGDADRTLTLTAAASIGGTNTGDVTLAGTPDYITISGQVITRGLVVLSTDVSGKIVVGNLPNSGTWAVTGTINISGAATGFTAPFGNGGAVVMNLYRPNTATPIATDAAWFDISTDFDTSGGGTLKQVACRFGFEIRDPLATQPKCDFTFGTLPNAGNKIWARFTYDRAILMAGNASTPATKSGNAGIFAKDVSGTEELFGLDEAGNAPQLTPHNFTLFEPQAPDPAKPATMYPWSYFSTNVYLGTEIGVDMARLISIVESLSGEQIAFLRTIARRSWADDQEAAAAQTMANIERWESRADDRREEDSRPDDPTVKEMPAWMLDRLPVAERNALTPRLAQLKADVINWKSRRPNDLGRA